VSDWLAVIILGLIEGITEFIPVSSTGHLLIAGHWLEPRSDLFNIVIQSGAVLAVIPLFSRQCKAMLLGWRDPAARQDAIKVVTAFVLTGVGGVLLDHYGFTLPEDVAPVAWALVIGGVLFIAVEAWLRKRPTRDVITWPVALMVGVGQLMAAVFPGASRSGTTILLALLLGLSRPRATEFSFLVGIPTMLAAGGLKITKALMHPDGNTESWGLVLLGTVVSAMVSFIAVKWLLRYVQSHTFTAFGYYRIVVGLILLLLLGNGL